MGKDASKRGRKTLKSDYQSKQHRQSRQKGQHGLQGPCQMAATFCEIMNGQDVQRRLDPSWGAYPGEYQARCPTPTMHEEPGNTTAGGAPRSLVNASSTASQSGIAAPTTNGQVQIKSEPGLADDRYSGDSHEEEEEEEEDGHVLAQQERISHQNIYLSGKSSMELRRLMHDLEQLAAAGSYRNAIPPAF